MPLLSRSVHVGYEGERNGVACIHTVVRVIEMEIHSFGTGEGKDERSLRDLSRIPLPSRTDGTRRAPTLMAISASYHSSFLPI